MHRQNSLTWPLRLTLGLSALATGALLALPEAPLVQSVPDPDYRGQEQQEFVRPAPTSDGLIAVDASFFEIASATGGDFYFWEPGEFAGSGIALPAPAESVLIAHGELEGELRFTFPVDAITRRLEIVGGAQGLENAVLRDPSGATPEPSPLCNVQTFARMRLITLRDPQPGSWSIELSGRGLYSLSVHAAWQRDPAIDLQPIELISTSFVELAGRPGHQGWFDTKSMPAAGESAVLKLYLTGSYASFEPLFLARDGSVIASEWSVGPDQGGHAERLYHVRVPETPFRIAVAGVDALGNAYQRVDSALQEPR